jgi:hypothetical protein
VRLVGAIAAMLAALGVALSLHARSVLVAHPAIACSGQAFSCAHRHPSWADPLAGVITATGVAVAAAILAGRPRFRLR